MTRHYLVTALRRLQRDADYTSINLASLIIGMTSCLAFVLVIAHELGYDRGFEDPGNLYRVACTSSFGDIPRQLARCPGPIETALKQSFPEVSSATALVGHPDVLVRMGDGEHLELQNIFHATETFFDVFDFPVEHGDAATALQDPGSVVLTFDTAIRIFGEDQVVGRTIAFGNDATYTVTAVLESDMPRSHLRFNALTHADEGQLAIWTGFIALTYVRVASSWDSGLLAGRLNDYIDENATFFGRSVGDIVDVFFQPVREIHLTSHLDGEAAPNGNLRTLGVLAIAAILTLLMAALNYVNLSTARYASREREVGVRKALGAHRGQVARQFLSESILLAAVAAPISVGLLLSVRPVIGRFTGVDPTLDGFTISLLAVGTLAVCLIVGLGAGAYPAFVLSRANPLRSIRGNQVSGSSAMGLRNILTTIQLFVTLLFVLTTIVAYVQLKYTAEKDLGYDPGHILYTRVWDGITPLRYQSLKTMLENIPGVRAVSYGELPGAMSGGFYTDDPSGNPYLLHQFRFGPGYPSTLGMELVEGRNYTESASDVETGLLLNEAAVRVLNLGEPVGARVQRDGLDRTIIGVLKDFNYFSLHQPIPPVFMYPPDEIGPYVVMRLDDVHASGVRSQIAAAWQRRIPQSAFTPGVLSDRLNESYLYERRLTRMMGAFSAVAIFVAFLGLFAMMSYTIDTRRQEIAIRRVLGASAGGLAWKLAARSITLFAIASATALVSVALIAPWWLADFAYRAPLSVLQFALVLAGVLLVTLVPILYHVTRVLLSPPALALRQE